MGTMANEVFLTLEESLARHVRGEVTVAFEDDLNAAERALDAGDFDLARTLVDGLTAAVTLRGLETFIRTKFIQAALFGTSQFVDPKDSTLVQSGIDMDLIDVSVEQFIIGIEGAVAGDLKHGAQRLITQLERDALALRDAQALEKSQLSAKWLSLINGKTNALVDIGANLSTSRLIQYGFLTQAQSSGVVRFQVSEVLDTRTCQFCRRIHGRIFNVKPAMERLDRLLRTLDPKELASASPFPKQDKRSLAAFDKMTKAQMEAQGFNSPPYHPFCRGILVRIGTVSPKDVRVAGLVPDKIKPTPPPVEPVVAVPEPVPILPRGVVESEVFGFVSTMEDALHTSTFSTATPRIRKLLKASSPTTQISYGDPRPKIGSNYSRTLDAIIIDKKTALSERGSSTWRHEMGHKLDAEIGDKSTFSYGSSKSSGAMRKDTRAFANVNTPLKRVEAKLAGRRRVNDLMDEEFDFTQGSVNLDPTKTEIQVRNAFYRDKISDQAGKEAWDSILAFHESQGTFMANIDRARFVSGWNTKQYDILMDALPDRGNTHKLMDFMGAVTKNRMALYWGHSNKYYRKRGVRRIGDGWTESHATEAFANYVNAYGSNEVFYQRIMERFAPNTVARFHVLVDEYLSKVPTVFRRGDLVNTNSWGVFNDAVGTSGTIQTGL